jgi:hypothetical protein
MGVPASEVGYTLATTGRGDHEVLKGYVVALEGKKYYCLLAVSCLPSNIICNPLYGSYSITENQL